MSDRNSTFIIVPAYHEAGAVHAVVRELLREYPHVIVVDDGSSDDTAGEARRAGATVLRHLVNRGQGAALQTGIEYALRHGAETVVTFDADGQHRVEDVARLLDALRTQRADIAVGSRFLDQQSNVPPLRRLLLRVATRFMRVTSGVPLTDAHNGLRAIRAEAARKIELTIDGMAHASEIVDQIRALDLKVTEVPVVIRYSEYSRAKGQSGFGAFGIAFEYLFKRLFR